jgi:FlaA1/EpsC-like NDP-sugar epimerase
MRDRLAIWGAGGHAFVVADIIRLRNDYELVGFVDDAPQSEEETFSGLPIFGEDGPLARLKDLGVSHLIFGFGDATRASRSRTLCGPLGSRSPPRSIREPSSPLMCRSGPGPSSPRGPS